MSGLPQQQYRCADKSEFFLLQVIWFAVTCLGMQVFDLDLIRCTVGKVSPAMRSCRFVLTHTKSAFIHLYERAYNTHEAAQMRRIF